MVVRASLGVDGVVGRVSGGGGGGGGVAWSTRRLPDDGRDHLHVGSACLHYTVCYNLHCNGSVHTYMGVDAWWVL